MKFTTLLEVAAFHAEHTPEKVCLIDTDTDRKLTFSEFWVEVRIFAKRLRQSSLRKGDRVIVRAASPIETFVAQYGINLAGGVFCPVERHMKPLKIIEMLDYYDSTFLISTERVDFNGSWIDLAKICENDGILPDESFAFPNAEDMCAIVFTTGTTGRAKGVMNSYASHLASAFMRCKSYAITENDVYCWVRPLDRESGIRHFGVALAAGCTAVHYNGIVFVGSFLKSIKKYSITTIHIQSFSTTILLKTAPDALSEFRNQLRAMTFSSGAMPERHREQIRKLLPKTRLFVQYSSTEVSAISYYEYSLCPGKENCVGKPFPGVTLYMLDDDGKPIQNTSKSGLGIVSCESITTMMGYWKDPELTAKTICNGRAVMTDVGYIDSDGFLYLMGRSDDVIVSGGHKIAPYEIENIAAKMEDISECVCVPAPNDILGSVPKLFVSMNKGAEFSAKAIYEFLSERIETYKLPRVIREIESFPRVEGSQKISRRELLHYD